MSSRTATGICIPCTSMTAAGYHAMSARVMDTGDVVKVGKIDGQWYVVIIFNKGL